MDETEERMNKQLAEAAKRENVLVLRLSAREQELQDVAAVAVKYRQQQVFIDFFIYDESRYQISKELRFSTS